MLTVAPLNKGWKLGWEEFAGEDASPQMAATLATLDAEVPGDVHLDLMRAGIL